MVPVLDLQQRVKSSLFVIHVKYATLEVDDVRPAGAPNTVGESSGTTNRIR